MGQVWKARDTRLDRTVAIKISSAKFSERFEREARAIAALNHPNICTLYHVGPDYLVMEYVEGGPVAAVDSPRKLLDIAVQLSEGLAAAHAAGIVHRDLKPDNILITREGRIKILDFGLAKTAQEAIAQDEATRTIAQALTDPGTAVGTIAYMSPEQARGQANLTAQSDQFSLGLVLYELAAGRRAFQRGSAVETMTAIIREDAEPLPASAPAPLRWIIERLLAKEPGERYDSTRDLYRELRQVRDRLSESASASSIAAVAGASARAGSTTRRRIILGFGLAAAMAFGAGLASLLTHPAAADFSAYKFKSIARDEATERYPIWSPDGKSIAYTADIGGVYQVFTKSVDSSGAAQLTHAADSCTMPFWSPDGATIYYISQEGLWSVGASGGPAELVMPNASAAAIHPDGKMLAFYRDGKLWAGPLRAGAPRELPRELPLALNGQVSWIGFSPDGSSIAVINEWSLWILLYPSGVSRKVGVVGDDASWFPDSRHLAVNAGNFNNTMSILDVTDGSSRVIDRVTDGFRHLSVSPDGRKIVFSAGAAEWNILEIYVPEGRVHTMVGGGGVSWQPDWAPSGTHYLFSTFGDGAGGGIVDRSATEAFSRRVADAPPGVNTYALGPRWAPDGARFLFTQGPVARMQLAIANASGGRQITLAENALEHSHAWSPDGEWVAFLRNEGGKQQLAKMKPAAGATPQALTNAVPVANDYSTIQWSPAGDWIAYPSHDGIYMISPDGNTVRKLTARQLLAFAFSRDGAQVYGIVHNTTGQGAQWQLYSIDVRSGADRLLAPLDFPASTANIAGFSLHPDGKRFLTSIAKWPYDIWMLEGFDQPGQKTWLDRLLRR
jgi:serine/threonine protein kinase